MHPRQWLHIRLVEKCPIVRRTRLSSVGAPQRSPYRSLSTHPQLAFRAVRAAPSNYHARKQHMSSVPEPLKHDDNKPEKPQNEQQEPQVPAFQMTFTCKQCETRSAHRVTKQAYFYGTVLITCPGCTSRHLISDHLRVSGVGLKHLWLPQLIHGTDFFGQEHNH